MDVGGHIGSIRHDTIPTRDWTEQTPLLGIFYFVSVFPLNAIPTLFSPLNAIPTLSSVLLRLFVSLGSVVGVSADALSSGSKSELSCSSNSEECVGGVESGVGSAGVVSLW